MSETKYCVKCGKKFIAAGREVICPECKAHAAEDAKRAAVLRAKRASWAGESVPVRISGRASTIIRESSAANNMPFASALDALLQSTAFFSSIGVEWSTITPYKSRRRDKHATETAQEVTSKPQDAPQDAPQEVKQAAKVASKPQTPKTPKAAKKAAKTASKAAKK